MSLVLGVGAAWIVFRRGSQHLRAPATSIHDSEAGNPIVYLRSFSQDSNFNLEEEELARIFNPFGPFLAIGMPGDALPKLGAFRFYVADASWQDQVIALLKDARLVIMRAGDSEGLAWELGQVAKILKPEQLVILVPKDNRMYGKFCQFAEQAGLELPRGISSSNVSTAFGLQGVIGFDKSGQSNLIRFPDASWHGTDFVWIFGNSSDARLRIALQDAVRLAGVNVPDPPLNWFKISHLAGLGLLFLWIFVALALSLDGDSVVNGTRTVIQIFIVLFAAGGIWKYFRT